MKSKGNRIWDEKTEEKLVEHLMDLRLLGRTIKEMELVVLKEKLANAYTTKQIRFKIYDMKNRGLLATLIAKKTAKIDNSTLDVIEREVERQRHITHFSEERKKSTIRPYVRLVVYDGEYNPKSGSVRYKHTTQVPLPEHLKNLSSTNLLDAVSKILNQKVTTPPKVDKLTQLPLGSILNNYALKKRKFDVLGELLLALEQIRNIRYLEQADPQTAKNIQAYMDETAKHMFHLKDELGLIESMVVDINEEMVKEISRWMSEVNE